MNKTTHTSERELMCKNKNRQKKRAKN